MSRASLSSAPGPRAGVADRVPGHERVIAQLEAAKLPFFAPEPVSLEDVYDDIAQIASRLGVPARGGELVLQMQRG